MYFGVMDSLAGAYWHVRKYSSNYSCIISLKKVSFKFELETSIRDHELGRSIRSKLAGKVSRVA